MQHQKSFNDETTGALYLVPTPIGNLEDITFRAIKILKMADLIAAEDTRHTRKLCNHYDILTPLVSYHEHNKETSGHALIEKLSKGAVIAVVSDAGMPTISDPGYEVVVAAIAANIRVIPLPGANAGLTALIASGLPTQPYYFYGFLKRGKKDKKEEISQFKNQYATIILYEAPHRLKETLKLLFDILGNRKIVICRELSKKFEEYIRGTLEAAINWAETSEIRGEFCLIIEGTKIDEMETIVAWWSELPVKEHVQHYIDHEGMISKEAIRLVTKERAIAKRDVYQAFHVE